jgi:hypothetical protein
MRGGIGEIDELRRGGDVFFILAGFLFFLFFLDQSMERILVGRRSAEMLEGITFIDQSSDKAGIRARGK